MNRPSETASGLHWLANFEEAELATASALVDSLRFVGLDEMQRTLLIGLKRLVDEGAITMPAIGIAERRLGKGVGLRPQDRATATAFVDFPPGAPLNPLPGSEGFVGGLLRDLAAAGNEWLRPDTSLDQLRSERCRSIVLVSDYSGSGEQIETLAAALARNPSIRSWRSLKLIATHVVVFAASPAAFKRLQASRVIDFVHPIEAAPSFATAPWPETVREEIVRLCKRHSQSKDKALGFGASAGLFATARGAPNNLPAVFWQQGENWRPLFPGRTVPPSVAADLSGSRPREPLPGLAARIGQQRVGKNERLKIMRQSSRELLRLLLLLYRSQKNAAELSAEIGLSMADTESLLAALRRFALVDESGKITLAGRNEVVAQKRARRRTTAALHGSDAAYYPFHLR